MSAVSVWQFGSLVFLGFPSAKLTPPHPLGWGCWVFGSLVHIWVCQTAKLPNRRFSAGFHEVRRD